ncbi:hypothetical protein RRG08_061354 [Elysia crispata]|uniref:Uncharacterized protein n=1 Tax=Elysia crispata TaxID=231223 RepID=A0AAE1AFB1_9GAST|nr:hypothetical protein RRG08_061354 [Elysia crispata]
MFSISPPRPDAICLFSPAGNENTKDRPGMPSIGREAYGKLRLSQPPNFKLGNVSRYSLAITRLSCIAVECCGAGRPCQFWLDRSPLTLSCIAVGCCGAGRPCQFWLDRSPLTLSCIAVGCCGAGSSLSILAGPFTTHTVMYCCRLLWSGSSLSILAGPFTAQTVMYCCRLLWSASSLSILPAPSTTHTVMYCCRLLWSGSSLSILAAPSTTQTVMYCCRLLWSGVILVNSGCTVHHSDCHVLLLLWSGVVLVNLGRTIHHSHCHVLLQVAVERGRPCQSWPHRSPLTLSCIAVGCCPAFELILDRRRLDPSDPRSAGSDNYPSVMVSFSSGRPYEISTPLRSRQKILPSIP